MIVDFGGFSDYSVCEIGIGFGLRIFGFVGRFFWPENRLAFLFVLLPHSHLVESLIIITETVLCLLKLTCLSPPSSLSALERLAMGKFISETLAAGLIACLRDGFFLLPRKMAYFAHLLISAVLTTSLSRTVILCHSSAFELFQGASVCMKVNLRNAYNLVCIWETSGRQCLTPPQATMIAFQFDPAIFQGWWMTFFTFPTKSVVCECLKNASFIPSQSPFWVSSSPPTTSR